MPPALPLYPICTVCIRLSGINCIRITSNKMSRLLKIYYPHGHNVITLCYLYPLGSSDVTHEGHGHTILPAVMFLKCRSSVIRNLTLSLASTYIFPSSDLAESNPTRELELTERSKSRQTSTLLVTNINN